MKLKDKSFNIIGRRKIWYCISLFVILAGIVSFLVQGFNMGIDFTGGNFLQLTFDKPVDVGELRDEVDKFVSQTPLVQEESNKNSYLIRTEAMDKETTQNLLTDVEKTFGSYTIDRNELVGPTIGKELTMSAILALIVACGLILVYLSIRFKFLYGVASVLTLLHDAAFLLSFSSILQLEINGFFIAAILTVIGYSINATIVIFDRIRENHPNYKIDRFDVLVNDSINQTMARSINTVLAMLFTLLALFFFGGETIKIFVLCMIIGVIGGGYSSVCISGSLYHDLTARFGKDFKKKK